MAQRYVSTCRIPTKKEDKEIFVKIKNNNEKYKREFKIKVYSPTNEMLSVYASDKPIYKDILNPGEEKEYKIDVSDVIGKVVVQIIRETGGAGVKMASRKSKQKPSSVVLQIN